METLEENNLIKFKNISKKKETMHANFRVKGLKRGVSFTASISVDIAAAEMHPGEPLENIIAECARIGVREFRSADFQFEGVEAI